jgi:hypothetical protein
MSKKKAEIAVEKPKRTKKLKLAAVFDEVEETSIKISVETPAPEVEIPSPNKFFFEGNEVLEILSINEVTMERHCKMSDGTTTWVPESVFLNEEK